MECSQRTEKLETLVQEIKHTSLAIHHTFAETDHKNVHPMPAADNNQLNMRLNLVVYYFQLKEYGKSLRILRQLDATHHESLQLMGKEWVARKHLIEIIVQYEKGNTDIAYGLIKTMRKQHEQLLQLPIHQRSRVFIDLIEQFIDKPYWVTTNEFDNYLNQILDRWPKEQEDLQAMTFYCWLKSKMLKKDYYQVLVETVNSGDE